MGEVYQARDTRLGRLVAIKFVSDELAADHVASERLAREARLTSQLNHPNIVTVHDVGDLDGRPFIVMEFVAGESLHSAIQGERLKPARVLEIASQVADGLAAAHDAGVIHRDLKPRNIMLTEDGRAKIVDFGVGKASGPAPGSEDLTIRAGLTDMYFVVGTPGYMSPEQAANRPVDFRADQFALGAIIYEMLTRRRAFQRDTPVQTMAAILEHEPDPVAEFAPDTPNELATILERCLAKAPANRYASTHDLARDLRDVRGLVGSGTSRSTSTVRRTPRRHWRWVAAAVAGLVAIAASAYGMRDRTRVPLAQARALLDRFDKQANVDQAIGVLSPLVTAHPRDAAARAMLAEAFVRKLEYHLQDTTLAARAGEEAGVALTLDQSSVPAHVVLAMVNASQNRFEGALGEADKAVALGPRHSRAWRERGRALFRLGRRDEAERAFRTAATLDPGDWTARNGLGAALLTLNRLDEAIREFERMQTLVPDNTRAYNNLGSAFLLQERFDKATEMYERSLSLDKNATAYSNLGTALYQQGLYADAARSFEGAVALPGATFVHWFNLGAARYWTPDLRARAKEAYETALKLGEPASSVSGRTDPALLADLASGHAVLALLIDGSEKQTHRSRALTLLELAGPQARDARILTTMATTYEELGDRPKALEWLARAIKAGQSLRSIERSPWLKDLHGDERYQRLRQK
jgi:tetratricopeptide (TPR) repeat protein